jgi:aminopeptidase N
LIVPGFNIGAMENIAAVTFGEQYVQRQSSSRQEREQRASTILHEMAHMWFGDLVTHEWWNGLWLNESFATQITNLAMLENTEFIDTWHGFFTGIKREAYWAGSRVTTHPIEMPVNSTADFFAVFDAITYEKGASVLKQLAHAVGDENYRQGVSTYLKAFSYGNTELANFIGYQSQAAGTDLAEWSKDWLYHAGFNTLAARPHCEDGRLQSLSVSQSAPVAHPLLRKHSVEVALYAADATGAPQNPLVISLDIVGESTSVPVPADTPCPMIINPNHNDWTLAAIELDPASLAALAGHLNQVPEPLARSIFLDALHSRAMAGIEPLDTYLDKALQLADNEENLRIQQQIAASIISTVNMMQRLRPQTDAALLSWLPRLEADALVRAEGATNDDLKRTWFDTFSQVAASEAGLQKIRSLLDGVTEITGLPISQDLRWSLLIKLASHGGLDIEARLAAESLADDSDYGVKSALTTRAALPNKSQKEYWIAELKSSETLNALARQRAVMAGLFPAWQTSLQLEQLPAVLQSLHDLSHRVDPYFMASYARSTLTPMCTPESTAMMQSVLENDTEHLDSTALRFLREAHQADAECAALRDVQ